MYMVQCIRNIELALGSPEKVVTPSEEKNRAVARKSIFLSKDQKKGHKLMEGDLVMKRPGSGISPMQVEQLVGKELLADVKADTMLQYELFK
jgi:sialic acid synthase SpsE